MRDGGVGGGSAVVYRRAGYVLAESEEARGYRPWLLGGVRVVVGRCGSGGQELN